jgi:hypothetical protein
MGAGETREDVLVSVMEREAVLATTDAGERVDGFQLLCRHRADHGIADAPLVPSLDN